MERGFLNAQHRAPPRDRRSFFRKFWEDQIMAPEKVDGNISIAWAALVFGSGIVIARTIAKDLIVPGF